MLRLSRVLPIVLLTVVLPLIAGDDSGSLSESDQAHRDPGGSVITLVPAVSFRDESLTFEERVRCQRRIEEVYWSHRIWPAENPGPKPVLSEVLPDAVIRERVETYLRKSAALEVFWSRPLTGEQLQAEMERMARDTKNLDLLSELFAALDDAPLQIAECLARPVLVDRLARSWYARDTRFHGSIRQQAE